MPCDAVGASGWTTRQMVEKKESGGVDACRLQRPGLAAALQRHAYAVVIIMGGTNDLGSADAAEISSNLRTLHALCHAAGAATVALTIPQGRQIGPWTAGTPLAFANEKRLAVHADLHTLRNGISLVIDTSNNPKKKVGNEQKLQVAWQNFPIRPQGIFILGTSTFTRIAINALIAFASLFAKNKIIARVRFAEAKDVAKKWGASNVPEALGGDKRPPTGQWVRDRLAAFPKMNLPEYV